MSGKRSIGQMTFSKSDSSRSVRSTDSSVNVGTSKGAESSQSRRVDNDYVTPFHTDAPTDLSFSRDSWFGKLFDKFSNWINPKDESVSEYGKFYGKGIGSMLAAIFGGKAISSILAGKGLKSLFSKTPSQADNDAVAIKALRDAGLVIGDSQSSRSDSNSLSWLARLFGGSSQSFNLGGLISGLTGIGTELGSSILNYNNQVKLIDKQNEYNTPANQMKRFDEAGLNPNLIYGMGSNGNQPASGSVAPVDFTTAQREGKMQMLAFQSDLAQKQANIKLLNNEARESDERAKAQSLANNTYMMGWINQQQETLTRISQMVNQIDNDNARVDFEQLVSEAQAGLMKFQSQPKYMQQLGGAEDAMNWLDGFIKKLAERIQDYEDKHPSNYIPERLSESQGAKHYDNMRVVGSTF